eukprot:332301_1
MGTFLSVFLLISATAEHITKRNINTISENKIQCNDASCNIDCLEDRSCTSYFTDDHTKPYEIHCPSQQTCKQCNINCFGESSCRNTLIYTYNCSSINIIATKSYSLYTTTIISDIGSTDYDYSGYLSISNNASYLTSSTQSSNIISHLTINNQNIANISINCFGNNTYSNNECNHISINQNIHSTDISLHCHQHTNCSFSQIQCPVDSVQDSKEDMRYHANCNLTCDSMSDCRNMEIKAEHGIPADFWIECDMNNNYICNGTDIYCGKTYESKCIMRYNSTNNEWYCNDINDGKSCINTTWVYNIHHPILKITTFWTHTYYGIPMTIIAGIVIICLFIIFIKLIRQKAKDKANEMLRYEVEDAMELEEQNVIKIWFKSLIAKIMGNSYVLANEDDIDYDDETIRRRIEMENLEKMTKVEPHDSDDDLDLDGIVTGANNQTFAYSYGHTYAMHDL